MVERLCPSFASPAHTRDNMVRSAVVQLGTRCRTPPGSDTGDRLKNERIRTERRGRSQGHWGLPGSHWVAAEVV